MREFPRKLRMNVQLQRELTSLIGSQLTDPRIGMVTVTHVDVAPDMRNANVLVSSFGTDAELADAVKALNGAAGRLRKGLGTRLHVRIVPALHFKPDAQLREADRLTGLIKNAVAEDRQNSEPPADE